MSNAARIATLNTRLTNVQTAIDATLARNAASYSTEIQSLTSLGLEQLQRMETSILNEITRLERGSRFKPIGFGRVTS